METYESIPGVRENDRSVGGANPQEDKALYSINYELTEVTGDEKYAREADKALEYFFKNCQSPETGLMAWGEHIYWNFREDRARGTDMHEINGEWPFWDQCYRLTPEASLIYSSTMGFHFRKLQINTPTMRQFPAVPILYIHY